MNTKFKQTEIGEIPSGWEKRRFENMAHLSKDIFNPKIQSENLIYLGLEHFVEGGYALNGLGQSKDIQSNKFRFKEDDVLFGKLRPYFKKIYSPKFKGVCSTDIWVIRANSGIDQKYIYFFVGNERFLTKAIESSEGTKMPRAIWNFVANQEYVVPPLNEQQQIASILSSLDDKIQLNRKMNKTFEEMAKALYKHWFIEEANGNWKSIKIEQVIEVKGGTTPSTKHMEYWDGDINWTSPRDLSNKQTLFLISTERKITKLGLEEIGSGLLPVGTVLLSSRAPIGYLTITDIPVAINQGYIAILCNKGISNYYIYFWLLNNMERIISLANGSTFLEISKSTFRQIDFIKPPDEKLAQFDLTVEPIFSMIKKNEYEIKALSQIRDLLLPKLMNGTLRI